MHCINCMENGFELTNIRLVIKVCSFQPEQYHAILNNSVVA